MIESNSRRFTVPEGWHVRYDFHDRPRGVSAILMDDTVRIRAVGFAKFNPHDAAFNVQTGKRIALGRALAKVPRHLTRPADRTDVREWQRPTVLEILS